MSPLLWLVVVVLLLCTHSGIAFLFLREGEKRGYLKRQFDERDREFRAVHF